MNEFAIILSNLRDENDMMNALRRTLTIEQYIAILRDKTAMQLISNLMVNDLDNGLRNVANDRVTELLDG
jgi:hypothetical protein